MSPSTNEEAMAYCKKRAKATFTWSSLESKVLYKWGKQRLGFKLSAHGNSR